MLNNIPRGNIPETEYKFGLNLMRKFSRNLIPRADFYKEVTYLALNCGFDELRPLPLPTRPTDFIEYDTLNDFQKKKVGENFFQQPSMMMYLKEKNRVTSHNISNKKWLEELLKRFEYFKDGASAQKVKEKLYAFR